MIDIDLIRNSSPFLIEGLNNRGIKIDLESLKNLDKKIRLLRTETETLLAERNTISRQVASLQRQKKDSSQHILKVKSIKPLIDKNQHQISFLSKELIDKLSTIPNIPLPEVPKGSSADDNVLVKQHGEIRKFDFKILDHCELTDKHNNSISNLDFELSVQLSGSRFVVLNGLIAKLHRILGQYMLDYNVEKGFIETDPPVLVKADTMYNTGQLPNMAHDAFSTTDNLWLIPTAEVALTNYVANQIVNHSLFPKRLVALTNCFRQESGASGHDTKGMIRLHQFSKVELVTITSAEQSEQELQYMLKCPEGLLERLEIPYQVMLLCTGDMGFASQKTYDIEAWIPSQNKYREISSCSNCGRFQARRMKARYKNPQSKKTEFCHTLNGSSLAVGRTLVAILENYQQKDGSITIPTVLQDRMGCKKISF